MQPHTLAHTGRPAASVGRGRGPAPARGPWGAPLRPLPAPPDLAPRFAAGVASGWLDGYQRCEYFLLN
jgi:hypothetical protein